LSNPDTIDTVPRSTASSLPPADPPRTDLAPPHTDRPILDIEPTQGWRGINLHDLWRYRDLLYIFVWRDLKVRYRQTLLGAVWVMGQPLLTMLIFYFLFNQVAQIDAGPELPYAVFVLAGVLPWNFFANGVQNSGNSLIGSSHLISKVYFPRMLIPASGVLTSLVDFAVSAVVLVGLMAVLKPELLIPRVHLLLMPVVVLLALALTLGVGLWTSALNVEYRDVRVVIPFVLQMWMFAGPVVYPLNRLPAMVRPLALLNPMTGVVEGFRYAALGPMGVSEPPWLALLATTLFAVAILLSGAFFFRRMERQFADVL
jgi:lipopolysaccharide transport system permease protein